tara:strand:+ start:315 stop:965 length:651 start_codon:yes stop_codon:yes gene_type:complete
MNIVSVILARGGSKGIPKKNIIDINGKPLIYYSIEASKKSVVSKTFVSTDSDEIAKISIRHGASGRIERPKHLATDDSKSDDALLHFANIIDFDILVFIQPTSPMINHFYINEGIDMIINGGYDSVFTATKEHWIPKWNNNIEPVDWDIYNRPMRQDKENLYTENGMFYITKRKNLLESKLRYSGKIGIVEIPLKDSFQIDSMDDLELIKRLKIND